jgi:hypothetical protein
MLVQQRPDTGEILVSNRLVGIAELIYDLLHANRIPYDRRIAAGSDNWSCS